MLLEKYENLLELSVKQSLIQSSLAKSISLGQTMFVVKLCIFHVQQEFFKSSV